MFSHHYGIARVDEAVQLTIEQIHIGGVKTGGRFVEDVERMPPPGPLQFGGELDPLGLATRQSGCGLSKSEISRLVPPLAAWSGSAQRG